ncbi:MAG TPA: ABC transporter permease, partial [Bryobacteraceae bacterium]|nr:ABC transporter permease [Bryobacteraceae bacterium]
MKRFLKRLRKRRQLDRDLEEEIGFHVGMSGREAFGNPTAIKEEIRTMWTFTTLETLWQDLRYAFRMLAKTPGVTLAAALALALGIGANTTMFTVLHGVFAIDLGIKNIERLAVISIEPSRAGGVMPPLPELRELRASVKSFESLAAYRIASVNLSDDRRLPERFWCAQMSATGFDIFDRRALAGRVFTARDERPDATPVAVISYKLWQNRYGGDVSAIGKTVDIDGIPRVVIGVMPAGIQVPEGVDL